MVQADLRSLRGESAAERAAGRASRPRAGARPYTGRPSMRTVGVIGLGYVGLPLAVAFAQEGCEVVGVDVDARKIEAIEAGESYIEDVPSRALEALAGRIQATTRYARAGAMPRRC